MHRRGIKVVELTEEIEQRLRPLDIGISSKHQKKVQKLRRSTTAIRSSQKIWTIGFFLHPRSSKRIAQEDEV
jgi:hypothetical protein